MAQVFPRITILKTFLKGTEKFCLIGTLLLCSVFGMTLSSARADTNQVQNFSFELATGAGFTLAAPWTAFSTGGGTIAEVRTNGTVAGTLMWTGVVPAPGAPFTSLANRAIQANAFGGNSAGVFQDINCTAGDQVAVSVDVRTPNMTGSPLGAHGEVKIEFYNSSGVLLATFTSPEITVASTGGGTSFVTVIFNGAAPPGTAFFRIVLASALAAGGLGFGDIAFDNVNASIASFPIVIAPSVNNIEAWKGKLITIQANITNTTAVAIPAAEINLFTPFGLDLVRNSVVVDGTTQVSAGSAPNFVIPFAGGLAAGATRTATFQVLVSSGVTPREQYDIVMTAVNPVTGIPLSAATKIPVRIIDDATFDQGTLLGKVFNDENENGIQDPGELGIPNVRLATEEGVVIYTDKDGKYHVPDLKPDRHIIKVDGHSLPPGTKFITEEKFLIKSTPGMLSKVSFAVKLPPGQVPEQYQKDLNVYVSQYFDKNEALLKVNMTPHDLKLGEGLFEQNPIFYLETNYGTLIADWRIEVRNEYGELIWTGYGEGEPPSEVPWSGIGDNEKVLETGDYSYRLIVADKDNREDWTDLKYFRVISKVTGAGQRLDQPFTDTGSFGIMKDGKRSIPLTRQGMIMVRGNVKDGRSVMINNKKVIPSSDGSFKEVLYMPYGKNNVVVTSSDDQGKTINYSKEVDVKDRYLFMVGLAEGELGFHEIEGNYRTLGEDDQFRETFYQNGRVAFYLKGKIKGAFLVTASVDTDNRDTDKNLSRLFTNLDPDAYYPVYGDASLLDYSARDSQERFFILVEADRSFFQYGSINTDFKDAELVQYNRTLSGAKGHFETLSTTKYGDPKAGLTVMNAFQRQLADHNEFFGTGGSIYYLKNRLVVEGSDKLRIEVRDKIQNIAIVSKDLVEGEDYEIDYQAGRIIMYRPISSVTYTDTIINNEILNGNKLVLVADYEYRVPPMSLDSASRGVRAWTHASDNLKIGGTYIRQTALTSTDDYIARGVDATLRLGENTRIVGEAAQTSNIEGGAQISFDGGLSFINDEAVSVVNGAGVHKRATAWSVKGETKVGKRADISGYYRVFDPGYAVLDLASQQGTQKFGVNFRYRVTDHLHLLFRQDYLGLTRRTPTRVPFPAFDPEVQRTTTLQGLYARGKWDITAEYRHQNLEVPSVFRVVNNTLDGGFFENAVGLKIAYQALDWFKPHIRGQVTMGRMDNNQIAGGWEMRLLDNKTIGHIEEIVGSTGDGTILGIERQVNDRTRIYSNLGVVNKRNGESSYLTTVGTSHIINDHSRIYTERRYTGNQAIDLNQQNLLGYDIELADKWNVNAVFERSNINNVPNQDDQQNAGSFTIAYNDRKRLESAFKFEIRYDETTFRDRQLLFSNLTQYKINDDLTYKMRLNTSKTRDLTSNSVGARFTELNLGFAYRPVRYDRFNFLTKYTYLDDHPLETQFGNGTPFVQASHTFAAEGAYDLNRYFQLVEKFAVRHAGFDLSTGQENAVDTYLWATRINFHVTRKWDLALEYRMLFQENAAADRRDGVLVELDRILMEYVRLGIGYDFSHFNDGITPEAAYEFHGFYLRLTGEF